jgi:AcrR family transcriptional regulator
MAKVENSEVKNELLERCLDYCVAHGFAGLSLRTLAEGVGTSHRMLIYHFQTREILLQNVLEGFRHRQLASLGKELSAVDSPESFERVFREVWRRLSSSGFRSFIIAFFECYIACVRTKGNRASIDFLRAALDDWLLPFSEALQRAGVSPARSRIVGRGLLASVRGLLLDALSPGADKREIEQTFDFLLLTLRPQGVTKKRPATRP